MSVHHTFAFVTSAYLAVQSLPLLLSPRIIINLLASEPRQITDLEYYLCRSLGLVVLAVAALQLIFTGALPVAAKASDSDDERHEPYAYAASVILTLYHAAQAFYLYTRTTSNFSFAYVAGLILSTGLFFFGVGIVLFGSDPGKFSKKTGADKRTGNWPFNNSESAREKKKQFRNEAKSL